VVEFFLSFFTPSWKRGLVAGLLFGISCGGWYAPSKLPPPVLPHPVISSLPQLPNIFEDVLNLFKAVPVLGDWGYWFLFPTIALIPLTILSFNLTRLGAYWISIGKVKIGNTTLNIGKACFGIAAICVWSFVLLGLTGSGLFGLRQEREVKFEECTTKIKYAEDPGNYILCALTGYKTSGEFEWKKSAGLLFGVFLPFLILLLILLFMVGPIISEVIKTTTEGTYLSKYQGVITVALVVILSIYAFRGLGLNKVFVAFLYYGAVGMFSLFIPLAIMIGFDRFFFRPLTSAATAKIAPALAEAAKRKTELFERAIDFWKYFKVMNKWGSLVDDSTRQTTLNETKDNWKGILTDIKHKYGLKKEELKHLLEESGKEVFGVEEKDNIEKLSKIFEGEYEKIR